jgi:predicted MFS family arabinose efflux permease
VTISADDHRADDAPGPPSPEPSPALPPDPRLLAPAEPIAVPPPVSRRRADCNDLSAEDAEDALLEGDRTFTPGTARAAFSYPTFRRVYIGAFLSNVGSWMQNVVLGAFAYKITESPSFVSLIIFAQLVPLLLLAPVGGTLADVFDRRKLLILVSVEQTVFAIAIAWIAHFPDPSKLGLFLCTLAIGIGQAVYAPTFGSLVPQLVDKQDLAGAVSLNSVNMNLSRVIGPVIGSVVYAEFGISWVFIGNAVSYLFIIGALLSVQLPKVVHDPTAPKGIARLLGGVQVAREDRVLGRCLTTMVLFSLFCLMFITQLPALANDNLDIDPKSTAYGLLYAGFGLGAVIGALSIGTFLSGRSLERIVRVSLAGFGFSLAAFAIVRTPALAYPTALVVGFFYFAIVTALATVLQVRLDERVRGRVMALWVMAFGGTVSLAAFVSGPLVELTSVTAVMLAGAIVAFALVPYADVRDRSVVAQ